MNNLSDFKKYKKAKVQIEHLESILKALDLSLRAFKLFQVYTPVDRIVSVMQVEKKILENYLKEQKEVVNNKGKK